ncbi:MAG TPA: SigB/SigF/SigG family RNA polymerase sigma factor [Pseudonocardiaceae bacterium]|jgi:RNA polymerase sigma-B factor
MPSQANRHETGYRDLLPLFQQLADPALSEAERHRLRDEIVDGHLPLAEHIAWKYRERGQSVEDLRQVALVGLLGAVDRFDPDRGTDFVAFAVPTIMGEIRRYFRDSTWIVSVPRPLKELNRSISRAVAALNVELGQSPRPKQIAERLGISLEAVYEGLQVGHAYYADSLDSHTSREDDDRESGRLGVVEPGLAQVENRETLHSALARLPERDSELVRMRFFEELTQSQIAARLGISQVHVSRLLARTVSRLRESFVTDER